MVAPPAAAPDGVLHRRIEFHLARKPRPSVSVGGGEFLMETLNPDAADGAGPAVSEGEARRPEKGDAAGFDPELTVARIYLGRIGAGLQNLGNTCYLNSVLQCLTYTEPFAAYLQSGRHKYSCRTAGFCALCALQNHVKTALQSTGKIVTPSQFVKNLRCISRSFRNSRQEDAHELMVNLLESMHKCCLPSGVPSESPSAYEKSLVHRIFGGLLRSQVKCTRCSHGSNKFDPFLDLSLDIAKATTLVRALQNFTENELLDGGEKQYQCEHCKQKVAAQKKLTIDRAPNVLTIHLKRFSPFNPREKIDKKVEFQPVLDLKPFVSDSKGTDYKYSLYGVLVHAGWNTQSGHYYCFVRTSSGLWHNLDDNEVCQVSEASVLKQKAYMLFYVRDRLGNTMAHKDNSIPNVPIKKMIPGNISCLNGLSQRDVIQAEPGGPSTLQVDKKSQSISNGPFGNISMPSADYCPKNDGKTEAATAPQNNCLSSAGKALLPQNYGATLSTNLKQITLSHKDTSSSGQVASRISARGNEKMAEMSLQKPKTDNAFSKLGSNASVASSIVKNSMALSEMGKQASHSQAAVFSKSTSTVNNMDTPTSSTKDAIVSNRVIPITSNGGPTSSEKVKYFTEPLRQAYKIVNELPVSKNNIVQALEQADVGKVSCSSEVSVNVVSADSCNGVMAKRVCLMLKKLVRYQVMNLWLGPRRLLRGSLKLQNKRKHKRTKRHSVVCKDMAAVDCSGDDNSEQQTSTSATVLTETAGCTPRSRKRAYSSARSEDDTPTLKKRQHTVEASAVDAGDHNLDMRSRNSVILASAEHRKSGSSNDANQADSRTNIDAKSGVSRHVGVLTKDFLSGEITVPCWDDVAMPNTETKCSENPKSKSIGYVLDEWDEEYDRGRTKKVRKPKEDEDDGANPFQEEANSMAQRKTRKTRRKAYQARPQNKLAARTRP